MKTETVKVTPALAEKWLKRNPKNRWLRQSYIDGLAVLMQKGLFYLNPQGIIFDTSGNLLDGQHRLWAVIKSGCTVEFRVTYDCGQIQDVLDVGVKRNIGDQLHLQHGILNANRMAAIVNILSFICLRDQVRQTTIQTMEVLKLFQPSIDFVYQAINSSSKIFKGSSIVGALSFCYNALPNEMGDFIINFAEGENISKGDAAFTLRKYLMNVDFKTGLRTFVYPVATACMYHVNKEKLTQIKTSNIGIDFFKNKQPRIVNKVRAIYGRDDS
jgi:hypothetical protein